MNALHAIRVTCCLCMAVCFAATTSIAAGSSPSDTALEFADGRIHCDILGADSRTSGLVPMVSLAMNTVLGTLPPPDARAGFVIRVLPPPPFYKRWLGADVPHGYQSGGEIAILPEPDNVKLAFRLAHEMSHWLVESTHPQRPPLWLDEGLAQRIGAQAAAAAGRTEKRGLARTPPDGWEKHALTPDELSACTGYGEPPAAAAAFYWQAERLVDTLFGRLGRDDFLAYLAILSTPPVPDWQAPLRKRWWFNDADFDTLARAIAPTSQPHVATP